MAHAAIRHCVAVLDAHAHLFDVTLEIDRPAPRQRVSLPVWIPGSYLVREFSQHLQGLEAEADGQPVALRQLNKNTWECPLPPGQRPATLRLRHRVYAFDASVRTAFLDASRGFFNPTSLCLRVWGREREPHALTLAAPTPGAHTQPGWQAATALPPAPGKGSVTSRGFGTYLAADYDELADNPVELGPFWSGRFTVRGVPHRLVVSGLGPRPGFDHQRLLRDTQAIVAAQMAFWHGSDSEPDSAPPHDRYLFLLHASADGYGGLEHRHSTALICPRADLPQPGDPVTPPNDGYTTLLGLISHEYFHTWNVKRLRPRELARYDYDRENHTELLWFFEGFTSYYDDLLLLRAGLIDAPNYLRLVSKTVNQVRQTPGRWVQSVAQASWEAWTKYYRVGENTPNATVSYYTKGSLVALCLDLALRADSHASLDDVMRALWKRCAGGPMAEADLLAVLRQLGRRSYAAEIAAWVHGTGELPLADLLRRHGLQWREEPAPLAQRLGVRLQDKDGLRLIHVLRGSHAEAAGLAAGDEWLAIERPDGTAWRVRRTDDLAALTKGLPSGTALTVLHARDGRVLRSALRLPAPDTAATVHIALPSSTTPTTL